jgi:hypothetical protein
VSRTVKRMATLNYHEVTHGDNQYYVEAEDIQIHPDTLQSVLTTAGSSGVPAAATATPRSYCYRKMAEQEFQQVLEKGGMVEAASSLKNATKGEKWFTESLDHSRQFQNNISVHKPEVVAEFRMDRGGYKAIRDGTIPQKGSKALQPKTGRPKNVFNTEHLANNPRGKVNIGLKGRANVETFNKSVVSVTKVNPNRVANKSRALRWLRRNKFRAAASVIGVVLDGISLTLSIIEDGGKFGPATTITVAEMSGGALGSAIGGALGSIIPFIGTTIGAFLGGLIGSLIAGGLTRFFLGHAPVVPGPGAPLLDTDPYDTAFGVPGQSGKPYDPSQDTPSEAFGFPDADFDVEQEFPEMDYETR